VKTAETRRVEIGGFQLEEPANDTLSIFGEESK